MSDRPTKYVMNHQEAAEFLGCSERHLYRLVKAQEVPATKLGKNWKYSRPALERFIEDRIAGNSNDGAAA